LYSRTIYFRYHFILLAIMLNILVLKMFDNFRHTVSTINLNFFIYSFICSHQLYYYQNSIIKLLTLNYLKISVKNDDTLHYGSSHSKPILKHKNGFAEIVKCRHQASKPINYLDTNTHIVCFIRFYNNVN
jgi:hypothetical protein